MKLYRGSLAYPIIGLIVIAVLGTAIPLHFMQVRILKQSLRAEEWAKAEAHHKLIKAHIAEVGERVLTYARSLKGYDSLRNATARFMDSGGFEANGDREPLRKVMDNLGLRGHVDEIVVAGPGGRVIVRSWSRESGDILTGWGVAEAMAGEDILVTTFHNGKWEIRGVSPILADNVPLGVIVIAIRIDDHFARKLSNSFNCGASLGNLKGIIASSLLQGQRSDIDTDLMIQSLREKKAKRKDYPSLSKTVYYAPLQAVDEVFCLIVEADTSTSDALLTKKLKETLVFSILILIAISVLGTAFAFKLINPLKRLKDKAERIARDIGDREFKDGHGNEVEKMVHVFDRMVEVINRHIAERKQAEEELRYHRDQLEKQVAERTVHLEEINEELHQEIKGRRQTEAALRRSKEELEEALRRVKETQAKMIQSEKMASVGQLAAGVAHEINNPTGFVNSNLNVLDDYQGDIGRLLKGYRDLFARVRGVISDKEEIRSLSDQVEGILSMESEIDIEFLEDDIPKLIKESRQGTERIRKIVEALKDFAHPGQEGMQPADINSCLESTLNVVWNELKYKAKVIKEFGELPMVQCNPQQINQVFMNLLVNAAQAIEKQGEIRILTTSDDGHVVIKISDTGSGIPEQDLKRIFDPFFTTKEVGKGTGLGLHIVYDIINQHGGEIDVESETGRGTKFTLRIPCVNKG